MNVLIFITLAFKSINMTLLGIEKDETTYFYVNIQRKDTVYLIYATNTKGLSISASTDTLWRLLTLNKIQPGKVKMKAEWRGSYYYVNINGKEKTYKTDTPLIDRHIVGYFLATLNNCEIENFKMLVPEKGIFPFRSTCKLKEGKKTRTLQISGPLRLVYRNTFHFQFDTQRPILYKYWDSENRYLQLKNYRIE